MGRLRGWRLVSRVGVVVVWGSVALVGCMSLERMAPPVDEQLIAVGGARGFDTQALVRGREIYLNQCIACHSVEPVGRYTTEQWREILPDMAQEAKLDRLQTGDLSAYLMTSHRFLRMTAKNGSAATGVTLDSVAATQ